MSESIKLVHSILWSPVVLWGMLLLGLYFMFRLHLLPFRLGLLGKVIGSLFRPTKKSHSLSNFQIIATNLGAVMGIGNMVGVASAIIAGGPGALFWMWLSSIFISTLKYGEILLALLYRRKDSYNRYVGGPMHYIKEGVGSPWLAKIYAVLLCISSFGIGNMVASSSMADALSYSLDVPKWIWGLLFMTLMLVVCGGGLKRVVKTNEIIVPFLVVVYCGACIFIMIQEADQFSLMLSNILSQALGVRSIAGGTLGTAMKYGMSRGIFSNEAGMGSATLTHVQSEHPSNVEQSMWGFIEVFLDTIIMCSFSGFIILLSDVPLTITSPVMLLTTVFAKYFGEWGSGFVTISIVLFGFASVIGWYFYGMKTAEYISQKTMMKPIYSALFVISLFLGTQWEGNLLWLLSDNFNGMVLWINVLVLFVLRRQIVEETHLYLKRNKK